MKARAIPAVFPPMASPPPRDERRRRSAARRERKVVAEFVEDARHLSVLWQCQIDMIQGFFLQEPSPGMTFDFQGESM